MVDKKADLNRAVEVIANAKVQRPTVCNALDTLLIDQQVAAAFVPQVAAHLHSLGVKFYVCEQSQGYLSGLGFDITPADDESFSTENHITELKAAHRRLQFWQ